MSPASPKRSGVRSTKRAAHGEPQQSPRNHAASEQLRKADKYAALGKLTAGIVHELRNPLAVLTISLETVRRTLDARDPLISAVQHAQDSVDRMHKIVSTTLSYARDVGAEHHAFDIAALIAETWPLVATMTKEKTISFTTDFPADHVMVEGDHGMIQQVIINLLSNAVECIHERGSIAARVQRATARRGVRVEISDTGSGINKTDLAKLFTPFFTTKHTGTGLGLTISRSILDRHGATITAKSIAGRGTTFTITFPRHAVKLAPLV